MINSGNVCYDITYMCVLRFVEKCVHIVKLQKFVKSVNNKVEFDVFLGYTICSIHTKRK